MPGTIQEGMNACASLLDGARNVVVVGHMRADGDVVGTMTAFYHHLVAHSKDVFSFLFEPVPERYGFLAIQEHVQIFDSSDTGYRDTVKSADVVILLDVSSWDRLPGWEELLEDFPGKVVRFDHHPSSRPLDVDVDITDTNASATGQLVYDYIKLRGEKPDRMTALGLFTAIATDTGWFRYSNTTAHSFRMVSELLETGINISEVYRNVYQRNELGMIRLMGRVISSMRSEMDGRLLWGTISEDLVREAGIEKEFETDILLDILRSSQQSLCVALFREMDGGAVRINLRSKGTIPVNEVAEAFGGGGHRNASGITIENSTPEKSAESVVEAIKRMMCRTLSLSDDRS